VKATFRLLDRVCQVPADGGERLLHHRGALMRKRIASIFAMFTVVFGVVVLAASPAAAADDHVTDADWNSDYKECYSAITGLTYSRVNACFEPDGDILWVQDKQADGYGVAMYWKDQDSGKSGRCVHDLGAAKGWAVCNKDFTEGHQLEWWIGWDSVDGWQQTSKHILSVT
jgi:hypothetical protein